MQWDEKIHRGMKIRTIKLTFFCLTFHKKYG